MSLGLLLCKRNLRGLYKAGVSLLESSQQRPSVLGTLFLTWEAASVRLQGRAFNPVPSFLFLSCPSVPLFFFWWESIGTSKAINIQTPLSERPLDQHLASFYICIAINILTFPNNRECIPSCVWQGYGSGDAPVSGLNGLLPALQRTQPTFLRGREPSA